MPFPVDRRQQPETGGSTSPEKRSRAIIWRITLGTAVVLSILICVLAVSFAFEPAANLYTVIAGTLWTALAPYFVLVSVVALILGVVRLRRFRQTLAVVTVVASAAALVTSVAITGRVTGAINASGGSANPLTALALSPMKGVEPDITETYTTVDGQDLHALVYKPSGDTTHAPVLFYVHGGGWVVGGAGDSGADMRWYADQGWVVVSVEYRLATATDPTWDKAPRDVACALSWTANNASRFGGDSNRIVAFGESAGGNLAVNASYAASLGDAPSGCGGQVPIPVATVAMYPVVDPQNAYDNDFPLERVTPKDFTSAYIGGPADEHPDRMAAISSSTYLSANAPQTLIIEPENDSLIPPEGVYNFVDQARDAGIDTTLVRIPFASHGFDVNGLVGFIPAANGLGNQSHTIVQNYLQERVDLIKAS